MDKKEKKDVPTWKIIVWGLGFVFFLGYGVVSFYLDAYHFIITRFFGGWVMELTELERLEDKLQDIKGRIRFSKNSKEVIFLRKQYREISMRIKKIKESDGNPG